MNWKKLDESTMINEAPQSIQGIPDNLYFITLYHNGLTRMQLDIHGNMTVFETEDFKLNDIAKLFFDELSRHLKKYSSDKARVNFLPESEELIK